MTREHLQAELTAARQDWMSNYAQSAFMRLVTVVEEVASYIDFEGRQKAEDEKRIVELNKATPKPPHAP